MAHPYFFELNKINECFSSKIKKEENIKNRPTFQILLYFCSPKILVWRRISSDMKLESVTFHMFFANFEYLLYESFYKQNRAKSNRGNADFLLIIY